MPTGAERSVASPLDAPRKARRSHQSIQAPAAAPSTDGSTSFGAASGLVAAAMTPTRPKAANPTYPHTGRRTAATPINDATIARTTPIPTSSAVLSFEPKVRIAKLFSHSGVASIAALPTATIGEAPGSMSPAASCATPIATAPQRSPTTIPAPTCRSVTGADVGVDGGATVRAIGPACAKDVARPLRCATSAAPIRRSALSPGWPRGSRSCYVRAMNAGRTLVDDLGSRLRKAGYVRKWLILGIVIGAVAGLGAIVFTEALQLATRFFLVGLGGYNPPSPLGEGAAIGSAQFTRPWAIPLVVGLGGLIAGVLVFGLAPEAEGHGTDAAIEAVHHNPKGIRGRVSLIKIIASAVTIGSGGSAGRGRSDRPDQRGFRVDARSSARPHTRRRADRGRRRHRVRYWRDLPRAVGGGGPWSGDPVSERLRGGCPYPSVIASIIGFAIFGAVEGFTPIFGFLRGYHFDHPIQLGYFAIIGLLSGFYRSPIREELLRHHSSVDTSPRQPDGEARCRRRAGRPHRSCHPCGPRNRIRVGSQQAMNSQLLGIPTVLGAALRQDPRDFALDRVGGVWGASSVPG